MKGWHGIMMIVSGLVKQRCMCCLNALYSVYGEEKERWRGDVGDLKDGMDEYEIIKGYHVRSDEIEKITMRYMTVMWNSRQRL